MRYLRALLLPAQTRFDEKDEVAKRREREKRKRKRKKETRKIGLKRGRGHKIDSRRKDCQIQSLGMISRGKKRKKRGREEKRKV